MLAVVAGLGIAAFMGYRLLDGADQPVADPPRATEEPAVAAPPQVRTEPGQPMAEAPEAIRAIELVAVSRLALYRGSLGHNWGYTFVPAVPPYATDEVTIHPYGTGVVFGPAPGASTPGPVRAYATGTRTPGETVVGVLPARDGSGYWIMDPAPATDGSCVMSRVSTDGQVVGAPVRHPCEFVPARETAAGFLGRVGPQVDPSSGRLLDPGSGTLTPIGGSLLAASDKKVVRWSRGPTDPLVVEDLVTGETVDVAVPPGRSIRQVALSADGRYLAFALLERLITVQSYEVWVQDLVARDARVATVTTLDSAPLDLAWNGTVLVVLGNGVDAYDAAAGRLYRTARDPMPTRLDVVALPPVESRPSE